MNDAALLDACPDYVSIGAMLKAHPASEAGRRYIYLEASNEGLDQQGEVVCAKALADSADFYRRYGNLDLDHYTQIGAKVGIPNYALYEIGRPIDVGQRDGSTFVKAEIYSGSGPAAEKANDVWSSLMDIVPPQRWYPSVGGSVLQKSIEVDPKTQSRRSVIAKVRWTNIGLSKTPVNQHVGACATVPVGVFAKCMTASGLNFSKALEAGYGTDSATLVGGGALREQSLDRGVKSYFDFRNKLSTAMTAGKVSANPRAADLASFSAQEFGLSPDGAAEYVERFMRDLKTELNRRKAS